MVHIHCKFYVCISETNNVWIAQDPYLCTANADEYLRGRIGITEKSHETRRERWGGNVNTTIPSCFVAFFSTIPILPLKIFNDFYLVLLWIMDFFIDNEDCCE